MTERILVFAKPPNVGAGMTHKETHGQRSICHSCHLVKVIDIAARQIAAQTQERRANALKVQPRGARR